MKVKDDCSPVFQEDNPCGSFGAFVSCWRAFATPIVRIIALIFKLEPEPLGGVFNYILHGWPFGPLHRATIRAAAGQEAKCNGRKEVQDAVQSALEQVSRKEFEPLDELLEIKMNFLFVTFFAPIMPIGLLPTLAARLLRVRSKATKLFSLRRRSWPEESHLLHQTMEKCFVLIAHITLVW